MLDKRLPEVSFNLRYSKLSIVYSEVLGTNSAQFPSLHNSLLPRKAVGNFTPIEIEENASFVQGCTAVKPRIFINQNLDRKPILTDVLNSIPQSHVFSQRTMQCHEHTPNTADTPIIRNFLLRPATDMHTNSSTLSLHNKYLERLFLIFSER